MFRAVQYLFCNFCMTNRTALLACSSPVSKGFGLHLYTKKTKFKRIATKPIPNNSLDVPNGQIEQVKNYK